MSEKYLLTIALPVYNGAKTLQRLLDSLHSQQNQLVEIILLNNASTDNTEELAYQAIESGLEINYIKQLANVGADKNFLDAVSNAKGKYVWIIGDDDYLPEFAVKTALNIIRENLDCVAFITEFSLGKNNEIWKKKFIGIEKNIKLNSAIELVRLAGLDFNFLSCVIHKRDSFLQIEASKYFNTYWLQLGVFLEYIENENVFLISQPLVVNAGNSISGDANIGGNSIRVILNICSIANDFSVIYGKSFKSLTSKYLLKHVNRKIAIARRTVYKINLKDYIEIMGYFKGNVTFWIFTTPLYVLPSFVHKLLYKVYLKLGVSRHLWKFF